MKTLYILIIIFSSLLVKAQDTIMFGYRNYNTTIQEVAEALNANEEITVLDIYYNENVIQLTQTIYKDIYDLFYDIESFYGGECYLKKQRRFVFDGKGRIIGYE